MSEDLGNLFQLASLIRDGVPVGWRGSPPKHPVRNPEELERYINRELMVARHRSSEFVVRREGEEQRAIAYLPLNEVVDNAYCLLDPMGLDDLPAMPVLPFREPGEAFAFVSRLLKYVRRLIARRGAMEPRPDLPVRSEAKAIYADSGGRDAKNAASDAPPSIRERIEVSINPHVLKIDGQTVADPIATKDRDEADRLRGIVEVVFKLWEANGEVVSFPKVLASMPYVGRNSSRQMAAVRAFHPVLATHVRGGRGSGYRLS